jgi:hypothetical protein
VQYGTVKGCADSNTIYNCIHLFITQPDENHEIQIKKISLKSVVVMSTAVLIWHGMTQIQSDINPWHIWKHVFVPHFSQTGLLQNLCLLQNLSLLDLQV